MKSINVVIDWHGSQRLVGQLDVYASRGTERYQFAYTTDWARNGLAIDPALELIPRIPYTDNKLWGAFQDISPDRWGRLVQSRVQNRHLSESDFLLGVSDHMSLGALRLSDIAQSDVFLADNHDVPKLVNLRELEAAVHRFEAGQESPADLAMIAQPGSSLGGLTPKPQWKTKISCGWRSFRAIPTQNGYHFGRPPCWTSQKMPEFALPITGSLMAAATDLCSWWSGLIG